MDARSHRHLSTLPALTASFLLAAGCSPSGRFLRPQTTVGALKSSVAQLESEKESLSREVADLKSENRRALTDLAEAEERNNDLATRLDGARSVISRQSGDGDGLSAPAKSASDSDRPSPRRATPAGSKPRTRKTPMAQIPSERRPLTDDEGRVLDEGVELPSASERERDPFGPQSSLSPGRPWLPVARGGVDFESRKRR